MTWSSQFVAIAARSISRRVKYFGIVSSRYCIGRDRETVTIRPSRLGLGLGLSLSLSVSVETETRRDCEP